MLARKFVIYPTYIMSNICYTIFRIEPYSSCAFNCIYCYVKMLPRHSEKVEINKYCEDLRKIINEFKRIFGMIPAFKMSTLVDPFPPVEKKLMYSYKIMKLCLEIQCPLIINTKSTIVVDEPWLSVIKELGKKKLLIYQPTIILLDEDARIVEPNAPSTSERLDVAKEISKLGIPVIIRLQPLIPYINTREDYLEILISEFKAIGAKQIIAEFLRYDKEDMLMKLKPLLEKHNITYQDLMREIPWEHMGDSPFKRPATEYRRNVLKTVKEIVTSKGLEFATCREGFYELHTVPNCCGLHYLGKYLVKRTLVEVLKLDEIFKPLKDENKVVMLPEKITLLRYGLRRFLMRHERVIQKTIQNQELLRRISPTCYDILQLSRS